MLRDSYELIEEKTKGAFGTVHLASRLPRDDKNILYAAKVIPFSKYRPAEVDALISCSASGHPAIVGFENVYRNDSDIWIIMQLVHGVELYEFLLLEESMLESQSCPIFRQICEGVKHIHDLNFIHGDIKPENVVFCDDDRNYIKICDFGLAR